MIKTLLKTLVFFLVLLLFSVFNTEMVLSEPFDQYEEYIVMDQSDVFDLYRLADYDEEIVSYGFFAQDPVTLIINLEDTVIDTIIYTPGQAIEIPIHLNDEPILKLTVTGDTVIEEIEFKHIESFDTYLTTLFADSTQIKPMDEGLLLQQSILLLLWQTGLEAQLIMVGIIILLYGVFMVEKPRFFKTLRTLRFNKWLKRILLHIIGSFVIYSVIIFFLVLIWGEEDTNDFYDSVSIYDRSTESYDLTVTLGITKVNGFSQNALEAMYTIDLQEKSTREVVGQLYCNETHVKSVFGYNDEREIDHVASDIFIEDACHAFDTLKLDIVDNQTGILLTSYRDIPLVVDSDMAMSDYGLTYEPLGTIFSIGVFSFSALVLMPLLEYWHYRYRLKHSNKEQED